jgi:hypothetical protein
MKTTRIIVNNTPGYIIEASPCPSLYGNLKNLICFRRLGSLSGTPVCEKKRSQEDVHWAVIVRKVGAKALPPI